MDIRASYTLSPSVCPNKQGLEYFLLNETSMALRTEECNEEKSDTHSRTHHPFHNAVARIIFWLGLLIFGFYIIVHYHKILY